MTRDCTASLLEYRVRAKPNPACSQGMVLGMELRDGTWLADVEARYPTPLTRASDIRSVAVAMHREA